MTLVEYQKKCRETAIYPEEHRISYPTLGLVGELGEFSRAEDGDIDSIIKEAGDCIWYCANLCTDLRVDLISVEFDYGMFDYYSLCTVVAEKVKKLLRDKTTGDATKVSEIQTLVGNIVYDIGTIMDESYGTGLEEVMEKNLEKLFSRKQRGVLGGSGDNR